jgi:hypothetical protein
MPIGALSFTPPVLAVSAGRVLLAEARSSPLNVSFEQSIALLAWVAEGAARASDWLSESQSVGAELVVEETHCCALGDFGSSPIRPTHDDVIAGVMMSYTGGFSGVALLSLEPEDALAWTLAGGDCANPLSKYVDLGGVVLRSIVEAAAAALGTASEAAEPRLIEDSLAGTLLGTHAPSDTVVMCSQIQVEVGPLKLPAHLYLLMEPKMLSALLGALSVSLH